MRVRFSFRMAKILGNLGTPKNYAGEAYSKLPRFFAVFFWGGGRRGFGSSASAPRSEPETGT